MKQSILQKPIKSKLQIRQVREQFTGKNLRRFGGSGLIRNYFSKQRIKEAFDQRIRVEGRRKSK